MPEHQHPKPLDEADHALRESLEGVLRVSLDDATWSRMRPALARYRTAVTEDLARLLAVAQEDLRVALEGAQGYRSANESLMQQSQRLATELAKASERIQFYLHQMRSLRQVSRAKDALIEALTRTLDEMGVDEESEEEIARRILASPEIAPSFPETGQTDSGEQG